MNDSDAKRRIMRLERALRGLANDLIEDEKRGAWDALGSAQKILRIVGEPR